MGNCDFIFINISNNWKILSCILVPFPPNLHNMFKRIRIKLEEEWILPSCYLQIVREPFKILFEGYWMSNPSSILRIQILMTLSITVSYLKTVVENNNDNNSFFKWIKVSYASWIYVNFSCTPNEKYLEFSNFI